jgi:hypothetical protein
MAASEKEALFSGALSSLMITEYQEEATLLAASSLWLAACLESNGSWRVVAVPRSVPKDQIADVHDVVQSRSVGSGRSRAADLCFSPEGALAVGLEREGALVYSLSTERSEVVSLAYTVGIAPASRATPCLLRAARWVAPVYEARCLALLYGDEAHDKDVVGLATFGVAVGARQRLETLLTSTHGGVALFDACAPGRIAVVMGGQRRLNVMHRLEQQPVFVNRAVDLRLSAPESESGRQALPQTLCVGDRFAVLGYRFPGGGGVVDVFSNASASLVARRVIEAGVPSVVSNCGREVLVGVSQESGGRPGACALYGFRVGDGRNELLCGANGTQTRWPLRSVCLQPEGWVCLRRVRVAAGVVSAIECATRQSA